jgi:hypothetical protein
LCLWVRLHICLHNFGARIFCRSLNNAARKKRTFLQHAKRRRGRKVPLATNARFGSLADILRRESDVPKGQKRTPANLFQDQISRGKQGPIETARQGLEPT